MFFRTTTIIFILIGLITGSFLALSTPDAKASLYFLDRFIIQPLVRKIANSLANKLANLVQKKLAGITGKGKSRPFFVLSWRNLILQSQGRGQDVFRSVIKGTDFCAHFKNSIVKGFGADFAQGISGGSLADNNDGGFRTFVEAPGDTPFDFANKCTFTHNIEDFKKDFKKGGGWDAWLEIIQPQNNYYGAATNAQLEKQRQKDIEEKAALSEAVAAQGYNGNQKDAKNGEEGGPEGCSSESVGRCTFSGRILSPGKVLGDSAAQIIKTKIGSYYNAKELPDVVQLLFQSIAQGVLKKLTNQTDGGGDFTEDQIDAGGSGGGGGAGDPVSNANAQGQNAGAQYQACFNACNSKPTSQCDNEPIENGGACRNNALLQCRGNCALQ